MVWGEAASARACRRLRRRDLDSEGDNERSFFERQPPTRLNARAQVSRRRGQLEPRNHDGLLRVRSSSGASRILANKRDRPEDGASAAVFGANAWGRRRALMRAPRGRGVVTPDLAQQVGVLPNCQRQHDRKESGSKHVILATHKGKSCASLGETDGTKSGRFRGLVVARRRDSRNFAGWCRKFRTAISVFSGSCLGQVVELLKVCCSENPNPRR